MSEASVGAVVRRLRRAKRWSIRHLAAEAHVGRQAISDLERNASNYQRDTLEAISRALGYSASDVEAMAAQPPPSPPRDPLDTLAPEWLLFAQRAAQLPRLAQATLHMLLLAFEEAEAVKKKPAEPLPNHQHPLTDFRHRA